MGSDDELAAAANVAAEVGEAKHVNVIHRLQRVVEEQERQHLRR